MNCHSISNCLIGLYMYYTPIKELATLWHLIFLSTNCTMYIYMQLSLFFRKPASEASVAVTSHYDFPKLCFSLFSGAILPSFLPNLMHVLAVSACSGVYTQAHAGWRFQLLALFRVRLCPLADLSDPVWVLPLQS